MKTIYCKICLKHTDYEWYVPERCPRCQSAGHWTTEPPDLTRLLSKKDKAWLKDAKMATS